MDYALLHQLALCCLLINSDYQMNEFTPALSVEKQVVKFQAGSRNEAAVIRLKDYRVLVFRGTVSEWKEHRTSSLIDWVKNFQQGQVEAGNVPGKVHQGFHRELNKLLAYQPSLVEHLKQAAKTDPLPLYVTGHSQGGALALLCAAQLHQQGVVVKEVVLLAAPRAGDVAFGDYCRAHLKVQRIEKDDDLVPLLPLSSTEAGKLQGWIAKGRRGLDVAARLKPSLQKQLKPWDELVEMLSGSQPVYDRIGTLTVLTPAPVSVSATDEEESIRDRWRSLFLKSITRPKSFASAHDSREYVSILKELREP